jgi:hypothetical protein
MTERQKDKMKKGQKDRRTKRQKDRKQKDRRTERQKDRRTKGQYLTLFLSLTFSLLNSFPLYLFYSFFQILSIV